MLELGLGTPLNNWRPNPRERSMVQDGASKIALCCLISALTMVYGRYNELVNGCFHGVYKPTTTTGDHRPVGADPQLCLLVYIYIHPHPASSVKCIS